MLCIDTKSAGQLLFFVPCAYAWFFLFLRCFSNAIYQHLMKWLYTSSLIRLYNLCPPSVNSFSLSLSFFFRFILLVQCPPPTFACMPSLLPITSSFSLFSYKAAAAASALFLHTRHMHRVHKRLSTARCNKLHN